MSQQDIPIILALGTSRTLVWASTCRPIAAPSGKLGGGHFGKFKKCLINGGFW